MARVWRDAPAGRLYLSLILYLESRSALARVKFEHITRLAKAFYTASFVETSDAHFYSDLGAR